MQFFIMDHLKFGENEIFYYFSNLCVVPAVCQFECDLRIEKIFQFKNLTTNRSSAESK